MKQKIMDKTDKIEQILLKDIPLFPIMFKFSFGSHFQGLHEHCL